MEVDGISVAAAEAIQNASVVSGSIAAGTGHLILETFGGAEIDAGQVAPLTNIQAFTAAGTWTKPDNAKFHMGYLIGGGAGGGSGARGFPADLGGGAGVGKSGGGGGFPGAFSDFLINATLLPATMAVVIGAGGVGGAAVTADNTEGNPGTNGGETTLSGGGITLRAGGGMKGAPGGFRDANGNGYAYWQSKQVGQIWPSYPGGGRGGRGGILSQEDNPEMYGLHGGGGGGGYDNGSSGPGGGSSSVPSALGVAGSANGNNSPINHRGSGGSGGARLVAGGNGGLYGAGGGGGGGANTGVNSGKGGDGAAGVLVIVTYF